MVDFATQFAKMDTTDLTSEEWNVLSVAFKNVVGTWRAAWRVLTSIEQKEMKRGKEKDNVEKVWEYKRTIEDELNKLCRGVLDLLEKHLIKNAGSPEA